MLEKQGNNLTFLAHYAKDGDSVTGLTVTIDVYEITRDGTTTQPVDDGACSEVGNGLYKYILAAASVDAAAEYVAVFHTAGDVDQADLPSMWSVGRAGTPYLDASIATVDGIADAIKLKTDNLPSDPADQSALEALFTAIKGAGWADETLVSIKAAVDAVDVSGVATAVWGAASRTLTQSAASVAAAVAGSTITCQRGDTLTAALTNIGALTGYSKLWFTVKENKAHTDAQAILLLEKTAGLTVVNGAVYTTITDGSITISDEATGDITITIKPAVTDDLPVMTGYYDIQMLTSGGVVSTLTAGTFTVTADVTRAVA